MAGEDKTTEESPLKALHIETGRVWEKVAPGYELTPADVETIVAHDRAAREEFTKKATKKKLKKEAKEVEEEASDE